MHQRPVLLWWVGAFAVVGLLIVGGPVAALLSGPPPALSATTAIDPLTGMPVAPATVAPVGDATAAAQGSDGGAASEVPTAAPTGGTGRTWLTGTDLGARIGGFSYRWYPDGSITPDPAWVRANIVTEQVPIIGSMTCHRLIFPQLRAALREIQRDGLASLIKTDQYAGCYVPRFIDRDPSRSLSLHSFGIAFDLNTATNQLGTAGDMDPRLVAIFQKWGFAWGGNWTSRPDPMHFELYALESPR
ncbi:hypothetical protein GCM10022215_24840 [Nocardioides fonticola]|uniref:Peptidase M15C domain-containing protein n=1 Tax=Nocardioides fonticola TaxID=450363 RepID=A0ABP7XKK9_9ACTN